MTAWSSRQRKEKCDLFFLFWLVEEVSFHCLEYSNEIELKRQQMKEKRKKKQQQQQKTEISINEEPKLRINSEITVIINYSRQRQNTVMNFLTHLKFH